MSDKHEQPLLQTLALAAGAAICAEAVTLPFDTAKVRLQLQNIVSSTTGRDLHKYRGSIQTIATIVREEGATAPFKGIVPGIHRQFFFTGLRLGLFQRVQDYFSGGVEDAPLHSRIGAALVTSAIGITVANPSDVVKIRQQACTIRGSGSVESKPRYRSSSEAYRRILAEEGFRGGLYRGYFPNLIRNSVISATELVAYSECKTLLLYHVGVPDGVGVHFTAGLGAGLAATVLGSPWDVIGTRLMARSPVAGGQEESLGAFVVNMVKKEGVGSLWKGFTNNFARIGSFNIVLWMSYEQLQQLFRSEA